MEYPRIEPRAEHEAFPADGGDHAGVPPDYLREGADVYSRLLTLRRYAYRGRHRPRPEEDAA